MDDQGLDVCAIQRGSPGRSLLVARAISHTLVPLFVYNIYERRPRALGRGGVVLVSSLVLGGVVSRYQKRSNPTGTEVRKMSRLSYSSGLSS